MDYDKCQYLHALEKQGHDVGTGHKLLHMPSQTLSQAAQEIQGHDHEIFVRRLILVWMLVVHLYRQGREIERCLLKNKKNKHTKNKNVPCAFSHHGLSESLLD